MDVMLSKKIRIPILYKENFENLMLQITQIVELNIDSSFLYNVDFKCNKSNGNEFAITYLEFNSIEN